MTQAKKVSQTDPLARWTSAAGGPKYYAYSTNYLVDTDNGIVDVEATAAQESGDAVCTHEAHLESGSLAITQH